MMKDILIDNTTYEEKITNGDFVTGESTLQHQKLLLETAKGDWKESPVVGVGAAAYLKEEDESGLLTEIKSQFELDGMNVKKVAYNNEQITIDANY
jgi:hypothetical protein